MNSLPSAYDFHLISPSAIDSNYMFADHDMSMNVNSGNMWGGVPQPALDGGLEKLLNNYGATERFGQVTPPGDAKMHGMSKSSSNRADSGASGIEVDETSSMSPHSSMSNKRPSERSSQKSRKERRTSEEGVVGNKKDKYREKNRVAAARCRAKKKEHTDSSEDTYRTQALQHTFCSCHPIQEYNLRKAQSMAFGANYSSTSSPVTGHGRSASFSHSHFRTSSVVEMGSSVMSEPNGKTPSVPTFSGMPKSDINKDATRQ
jgi:hypothetical protein